MCPSVPTARHEQRAAEHEQRVHDRWAPETARYEALNTASAVSRWTTTGNTGARESSVGQARKAEASVPAAPTVGHEPTYQPTKADAGVGATTGKAPDAASSAPLCRYIDTERDA